MEEYSVFTSLQTRRSILRDRTMSRASRVNILRNKSDCNIGRLIQFIRPMLRYIALGREDSMGNGESGR
jgi:hypothetical protein